MRGEDLAQIARRLIHGAAPHAYVLCHLAGQEVVDDDERFPMPPLRTLVELHERISLLPRPANVVALALNTSLLDDDAARAAIAAAADETGLPTDDPVRFGPERITKSVLEALAVTG